MKPKTKKGKWLLLLRMTMLLECKKPNEVKKTILQFKQSKLGSLFSPTFLISNSFLFNPHNSLRVFPKMGTL